jgi:hypothetical protein
MDVRWPGQAEMAGLRREERRQRFWLAAAVTATVSGILVLTLGTSSWPGWLLLAAGIAGFVHARPAR